MSSNSNFAGDLALAFVALVTIALGLFAVLVYVYLMLAVIVFVVVAVCSVFAFIAFAWSTVCFIAWRRPLRVGKIFLHPDDARAFVTRGVFGGIAFPLFLLGASILWEFSIDWEFLPHFFVAGYTAFSAGLEYLFHKRRDIPYVYPDLMPQMQIMPPQQRTPLLSAPTASRFATWDDEEAGR